MKKRFYINRKDLISATGLTNFIKEDCIIDYLDILENNNYKIEEDLSIKKRKYNEICEENDYNKRRKSSFDYIVENGYKFEEDILIRIKDKMTNENQINRLLEIKENNFDNHYKNTINAVISKKYDLILGGLLINKENNTYGYPDMIVSGYWINKYIKDKIIEIKNDRLNYYIIDIKSSTINLISNGDQISSLSLYNGYKMQIYIYTQALNSMLKENGIINDSANKYGFILGKKYKYILNKNEVIINDPLERLGIIDYENEKICDCSFKNKLEEGIKWKKDINMNWKKYNLMPINKDELYPNMKNHYDKNYKKIKKSIAVKNKEITLLWNCGIKNRKLAWNNDIKSYDDKRLCTKILGFKENTSRSNILSGMLSMIHTNRLLDIDTNSNYMNWKDKYEYEFYVDFETYNYELESDNLHDEEIEYGYTTNNQKIYMIGVEYNNNFACFIIKYDKNVLNNIKKIINNKKINNKLKCNINSYIFCEDEKDLIEKYVEYINSFKPKTWNLEKYYNNMRLIHWSHAEPVLFNKKILNYNLIEKKYILPWYDLLKVFKNDKSPILIKECFSFSLKEIVRKLCEYEFININWSDLDDGLLSSFIARDIYMNSNIITDKNNEMVSIVEYNYIDCLAINKILDCLRRL
jgi:hypothetical protein